MGIMSGVHMDFKQQLTRQIGFLARSCESFDAGYLDESIRIATTIRVLIHDTLKSTSLLKHLGASDIKLSSTVSKVSRPNVAMQFRMGRFSFGPQGTTFTAKTAREDIRDNFLVGDWWKQIVYTVGSVNLSRKDLVLAAANRDGGAHVDPALTVEYESIMNVDGNGFFNYVSAKNPEKVTPIIDAHLIYIRQMGAELLHSPELLALAQ
jgi:hypothetical protein